MLALVLNDLQTKYVSLLDEYPALRMYETAKTVVTTAYDVASSVVTGVVGFFSTSKIGEPVAGQASSNAHMDPMSDFFVECITKALLFIAPEELRVKSIAHEINSTHAAPAITSQ